MKKIFASLGIVLAATLSLTNCSKELESPSEPLSEGIPFEVSTVLTKTANNGKKTEWAKDDAMNIFHAAPDAATYTSDGEFTVDEGLTGIFSGMLDSSYDASEAHDWYAFYPYGASNTTPAGIAGATVGGISQTQSGNNSTAHLAGTACPLYGVSKAVAAGAVPSFKMNLLFSIVCVEVNNASGSNLAVSSVAFTSTEDIVGKYDIDFTGSAPAYKSSSADLVSNTARLSVSGGEVIAGGSSAKFYLVVKPHTVAANSTLRFSVNGYEKTVTVSEAGASFKAGKIKTVNFKYDRDYVTLPWSIDGTGGSAAWSGTPGISQSGLSSSDYASSNSPYLAKMDNTGDYFQVKYDSLAKTVTFGVKMIGGAKSSSMTLSGSSDGTTFTDIETFSITGSQNAVLSFTSSNAISADYRYIRLTFTKGSNIGLGPVSITSAAPRIEAANVADVSARGLSTGELTFSIINPVAGTSISASCDGTVVTEVLADDSGTVLYDVAENTTGAAREGTITLTYGSVTREVKVLQNADVFESDVTEIVLDATAGSEATFTVTSDFDWYIDFSGAGFKFSTPSYTWSGDGKQTVTVTATSANSSESGTVGLGWFRVNNSKTGKTITLAVKQKSSYSVSTLALSGTNKFGTDSGSSLTADDGTVWTVTTTSASGDIKNSYISDYFGQQFGTSDKPWTGTFSADISGKTVTKIEIVANTGSAATVSATVGGAAFGEAVSVTQRNKEEVTYSFTGSASGEIVLTVSGTVKAFYLGKIIVTGK